jgi:hypothetical protein
LGTLENPRHCSRRSTAAVTPQAVQVATPFAPPPAQQRHTRPGAALAGLLLLLTCAAGLGWYVFTNGTADWRVDPVLTSEAEILAEPSAEARLAKVATPPVVETPAPSAATASASPAIETKPPSEPAPKPEPAAPTPKVALIVAKPQPLAKLTPPEPPPAKQPPTARHLPKDEQDKVDAAIETGVRFLKARQLTTGTWRQDGFHAVGYAALPALTLLECQVSGKDPVVRRAASFVRRAAPMVNDTYDLSLALLFLDRLGEPADRSLIQQIALRLVVAQTDAGGWPYDCPMLAKPEMTELMRFLRQTRPREAQLLSLPADGKPEQKSLTKAVPGAKLNKSLPASDKSKTVPGDSPAKEKPQEKAGARSKAASKKAASGPEKFPPRIESLPPVVRRLAIVNATEKPRGLQNGKGRWMQFFGGRDDNSNSQFALLALWAARRHDVPTERTLRLADKRFHTSQNTNGGWGYQVGTHTTSAMTGVGLLGLAIGHGSSEEGLRAAARGLDTRNAARNLLNDPAIHTGLEAFAQYLGGADDPIPVRPNLYFLWTVERVAMLYNLQTIGKKDWYRWGVHILVPGQQPAGGWFLGGYPGADVPIDTSFALLFLKRSNLVQDLTRNLTFYLAITDPAVAPKKR